MTRLTVPAIALAMTGAVVSLAANAQERVCVEMVSGVCLKYETRATKAPAGVSAAQREERSLSLRRADRRVVQKGLRAAGFYNGAIDGVFGAGTRRALRRWQSANGGRATGFLTASDVAGLSRASASETASPPRAPKAEEFGELIHGISCHSLLDGYSANLNFRRDGKVRALAPDANLSATWTMKGGRFCILNRGRESRCGDIGVAPTKANRKKVRNAVRRIC